jgi:hypothetical protein
LFGHLENVACGCFEPGPIEVAIRFEIGPRIAGETGLGKVGDIGAEFSGRPYLRYDVLLIPGDVRIDRKWHVATEIFMLSLNQAA